MFVRINQCQYAQPFDRKDRSFRIVIFSNEFMLWWWEFRSTCISTTIPSSIRLQDALQDAAINRNPWRRCMARSVQIAQQPVTCHMCIHQPLGLLRKWDRSISGIYRVKRTLKVTGWYLSLWNFRRKNGAQTPALITKSCDPRSRGACIFLTTHNAVGHVLWNYPFMGSETGSHQSGDGARTSVPDGGIATHPAVLHLHLRGTLDNLTGRENLRHAARGSELPAVCRLERITSAIDRSAWAADLTHGPYCETTLSHDSADLRPVQPMEFSAEVPRKVPITRPSARWLCNKSLAWVGFPS